MKDGVNLVYCERPGCGKVVGAQRVENNKVVEEEWEPGHCMEDILDDGMNVIATKHFCSVRCSMQKDEFMEPEEIEDE